jgi:hypothetical protein
MLAPPLLQFLREHGAPEQAHHAYLRVWYLRKLCFCFMRDPESCSLRLLIYLRVHRGAGSRPFPRCLPRYAALPKPPSHSSPAMIQGGFHRSFQDTQIAGQPDFCMQSNNMLHQSRGSAYHLDEPRKPLVTPCRIWSELREKLFVALKSCLALFRRNFQRRPNAFRQFNY